MSSVRSIVDVELPSGDRLSIVRRRFGAGDARFAVVAGIRGDTPEGIRVAHLICKVLAEIEADLRGVVDVYPCVNPLAAWRGARRWPLFDVDLNRCFPGRPDGHPPDCVAHALVEDVRGAQNVVEVRGAHTAFREAPQAHVRVRDEDAATLATSANVAVVWRRTPGPAAPTTFTHQFPGSIVLEGGTGNRLTKGVGHELANGVLSMLATCGIVPEEKLPFHWAGMNRPRLVTDAEVHRVRTEEGGLFMPEVEVLEAVLQGARLGTVVDPISGDLVAELLSPVAGLVMAVREHPVVLPGSMVARVASQPAEGT